MSKFLPTLASVISACFIFGPFNNAANAQPTGVDLETIEKFDLNNDGRINPGREIELLGAISEQLSQLQRANYLSTIVNPDPAGGFTIAEYDTSAWYERLETACTPGQRFFLRDKVINSSLLQPGLRKAAGDQAAASITRLNDSDTWQWNIKGAITAVPIWSPCRVDPNWNVDDLVISGVAVAPFLEFSGSGETGRAGSSSLLFGANAEMQLLGGPLFDLQQINFTPSFQTDFDFDAEIYRFGANWYPVSNALHLGSYLGAPGSLQAWWSLSVSTDFLSVRNAGRTSYRTGTEYGWLSAEIGGHVKYKASEQMPSVFADANYVFRRDILNNDDANFFEVKAGIFLDPGENSSLTLSYQHGTDVDTNSPVDQVTLRFGIKY